MRGVNLQVRLTLSPMKQIPVSTAEQEASASLNSHGYLSQCEHHVKWLRISV
jgi:hypothetical protein